MEVARLRRFLDNLIDMVRIDSGTLALHPERIDLTDAIGGAVHDLMDLFPERHIDLKVPANLGLAIVKGFADAMGVRASAVNQGEGGAAFSLHFPNQLLESGSPVSNA